MPLSGLLQHHPRHPFLEQVRPRRRLCLRRPDWQPLASLQCLVSFVNDSLPWLHSLASRSLSLQPRCSILRISLVLMSMICFHSHLLRLGILLALPCIAFLA